MKLSPKQQVQRFWYTLLKNGAETEDISQEIDIAIWEGKGLFHVRNALSRMLRSQLKWTRWKSEIQECGEGVEEPEDTLSVREVIARLEQKYGPEVVQGWMTGVVDKEWRELGGLWKLGEEGTRKRAAAITDDFKRHYGEED